MNPTRAWATRLIALAMLLSFALNSYALPSHPIAPADGPPGDVFVGDPNDGGGGKASPADGGDYDPTAIFVAWLQAEIAVGFQVAIPMPTWIYLTRVLPQAQSAKRHQ